jgi:hypothetical protein
MEEKIIEAKFGKNTLAWTLLAIGIALLIFSLILGVNEYNTRTFYDSYYSIFGGYHYSEETAAERYGSLGNYLLAEFCSFVCFEGGLDYWFAPVLCLGIIVLLVALFFFWQMSRGKLTVTNQRVTGKASFGKTVDLPLNQISAVALEVCRSITVATSSGRIHFWFVQNREEIRSALTDIIGKAQVADIKQHTPPVAPSATDEIKKYKELLDEGIITQEEFDAKKKQLLGL